MSVPTLAKQFYKQVMMNSNGIKTENGYSIKPFTAATPNLVITGPSNEQYNNFANSIIDEASPVFSSVPEYPNDAAAQAGGIILRGSYYNNVLNVWTKRIV